MFKIYKKGLKKKVQNLRCKKKGSFHIGNDSGVQEL